MNFDSFRKLPAKFMLRGVEVPGLIMPATVISSGVEIDSG